MTPSGTRQSQSNYEKGTRKPDTEYLAAIARAGVDVLYVVTGVRSTSLGRVAEEPATYGARKGAGALSKKEAALLDNYRHSPSDARDALIKTSAAFAQRPSGHIEGKTKRKKPG